MFYTVLIAHGSAPAANPHNQALYLKIDAIVERLRLREHSSVERYNKDRIELVKLLKQARLDKPALVALFKNKKGDETKAFPMDGSKKISEKIIISTCWSGFFKNKNKNKNKKINVTLKKQGNNFFQEFKLDETGATDYVQSRTTIAAIRWHLRKELMKELQKKN